MRVHRQGTRNGHPLLLTTRQVRRVVIAVLVQADFLQQLLGLFDALGTRPFEHAHRALDDVLQHGHVRPQVEVLEHHAQPAAHALDLTRVARQQTAVAVTGHLDGFAVQADAAFVRGFQQVDAAQERTFSRAAGAENRDYIAFVRVQGNTLEHVRRAVGFLNVANRQSGEWLSAHNKLRSKSGIGR